MTALASPVMCAVLQARHTRARHSMITCELWQTTITSPPLAYTAALHHLLCTSACMSSASSTHFGLMLNAANLDSTAGSRQANSFSSLYFWFVSSMVSSGVPATLALYTLAL